MPGNDPVSMQGRDCSPDCPLNIRKTTAGPCRYCISFSRQPMPAARHGPTMHGVPNSYRSSSRERPERYCACHTIQPSPSGRKHPLCRLYCVLRRSPAPDRFSSDYNYTAPDTGTPPAGSAAPAS